MRPSPQPGKMLLASIVLVGAVLRLYALGAKGLWYDEALSWSFLRFSPVDALIRCARPQSLHPPFFFLLMYGGSDVLGDSEFALRLIPAMCGILSIVIMFIFVNDIFLCGVDDSSRPWAPLLAAALMALSPLQIHLSRQVRGYSLAVMLLLLSSVALNRAIGRTRLGVYWTAWSITAAMACYTHNICLIVVFGQFIFISMVMLMPYFARSAPLSSPIPGPSPARSEIFLGEKGHGVLRGPVMATAIFVCLFVIPWSLKIASQGNTLKHGKVAPLSYPGVPGQIFHSLCGTSEYRGELVDTTTSILVVGFSAVLWTTLIARPGLPQRYLLLAGLMPVLLLLAFSVISSRSVFRARYLSLSQPFWLAAIASVYSYVPRRLRAVWALWLLGSSAYFCYDHRDSIGSTSNPGMRAAVAFVRSRTLGQEPVFAMSPFVFFGASYYLRDDDPPKLCLDNAFSLGTYASEHLSETDCVTFDSIASIEHKRIWIIESESYGGAHRVLYDVPSNWIQLESAEFIQDLSYIELPIVVRHFEIR